MPNPMNVEFIVFAMDAAGNIVDSAQGFTNDYSTTIETFQQAASKKGAVRICVDLVLPTETHEVILFPVKSDGGFDGTTS